MCDKAALRLADDKPEDDRPADPWEHYQRYLRLKSEQEIRQNIREGQ